MPKSKTTKVREQVWVYSQQDWVKTPFRIQAVDQVLEQVWTQVNTQVREHIYAQVRGQVWDQLIEDIKKYAQK